MPVNVSLTEAQLAALARVASWGALDWDLEAEPLGKYGEKSRYEEEIREVNRITYEILCAPFVTDDLRDKAGVLQRDLCFKELPAAFRQLAAVLRPSDATEEHQQDTEE